MKLKISRTALASVGFVSLGAILFSLNSSLELNYMIKGYMTLLEMQAAIAVLYLFFRGAGKFKAR